LPSLELPWFSYVFLPFWLWAGLVAAFWNATAMLPLAPTSEPPRLHPPFSLSGPWTFRMAVALIIHGLGVILIGLPAFAVIIRAIAVGLFRRIHIRSDREILRWMLSMLRIPDGFRAAHPRFTRFYYVAIFGWLAATVVGGTAFFAAVVWQMVRLARM